MGGNRWLYGARFFTSRNFRSTVRVDGTRAGANASMRATPSMLNAVAEIMVDVAGANVSQHACDAIACLSGDHFSDEVAIQPQHTEGALLYWLILCCSTPLTISYATRR
jgi:hypothetical protein